jgi:hypothetical protein
MAIDQANTTMTRRRALRRLILMALKTNYDRQLSLGTSFDVLMDAIGNGSAVTWMHNEVTESLSSLSGDRLIETADGGWRLTADGSAFIAAGFPWAKIDRFG